MVRKNIVEIKVSVSEQKNRTYIVKEQIIDLKYQAKDPSWKAPKRNKEKA